jgi:hypothetical protein
MDEREFLPELESEVTLELGIARSSSASDVTGESPAEWLFDPSEVEREEVGLLNLEGALKALGGEPPQ